MSMVIVNVYVTDGNINGDFNVDVVDADIEHLCEDPVEPLQGPVQVKL